MPTPVSMLVIKVASRCNLNCSYCYEYNMGDDSWREKPKVLSLEIARNIGRRIRQHCVQWSRRQFTVSFHGGEPLLAGVAHLTAVAEAIRDEASPDVTVDFGMQTNGMLMTAEAIEALSRLRFSVGVSIDGVKETNDRYRITRNGKSSFARTVAAIERLKNANRPGLFAGLLAVIDLQANPIETFDFLSSFSPPSIDFLLPHGNWNRPPPGKARLDRDSPYADWLITIFDAWFRGRHNTIEVRTFEEIIEQLAGGHGALETLGVEPVTLLTIGSDGAIEGVDTMKSVYPGAQTLGLNVGKHSFDDALNHRMVAARQAGIEALSPECTQCELVRTCGGGYFPHRYSVEKRFANRSIYCSDLYKLIDHIRRAVVTEAWRSKAEAAL